MHEHSPKSIDRMTFAELDALREQIDLPQVQLCQRGEFNPATYARWRRWLRGEGGSKPLPRSVKAVREVLKAEMERRAGDPPDQALSVSRPAA